MKDQANSPVCGSCACEKLNKYSPKLEQSILLCSTTMNSGSAQSLVKKADHSGSSQTSQEHHYTDKRETFCFSETQLEDVKV